MTHTSWEAWHTISCKELSLRCNVYSRCRKRLSCFFIQISVLKMNFKYITSRLLYRHLLTFGLLSNWVPILWACDKKTRNATITKNGPRNSCVRSRSNNPPSSFRPCLELFPITRVPLLNFRTNWITYVFGSTENF